MEERGNHYGTTNNRLLKSRPLLRGGNGRQRVVGYDSKEIRDKNFPVLPVISAATQQQQQQQQRTSKAFETSKNPLSLLASESRATAVRNSAQERWRSALLEYEVSLKELIANDSEAPPSDIRLIRTFQLYDAVSRVVADQSPELADMLKMFRVEFCRATFIQRNLNVSMPQKPPDDDGDDHGEELAVTYFDEVDVLRRQNAALLLEVNLGNTRDNLAYMGQQIEHLTEINSFYENEVNRLERENERATESYRKAREELDKQKHETHMLINKFDEERQQLLQENKDMQLRLYRLQKYLKDRESVVVRDAYKYMKEKKMGVMTRLFDEGDERVSILVMLSQLESRVNEELDEYDKETLLCDESEISTRQLRMLDVVSVLLEEMHLCEKRYLRLLPHSHLLVGEERDETDGYVSLLSNPQIYDRLVARLGARENFNMASLENELEVETSLEETKDNLQATTMESDHGTTLSTSGRSRSNTSPRIIMPETEETPRGENILSDATLLLKMEQQEEVEKEEKEKGDVEKLQPQEEEGKNLADTTMERRPSGPERGSAKLMDLSKEAFSLVKRKQKEWVENIFGMVVETEELLRRVRKQSGLGGHITDEERLMAYVISKPMLDVSSNKFQCGIDIFTGPGPLTQSFLCSVIHVDPVDPLHVPQGTNFMHVKYRNPLRLEAVEDDPIKASSIAATPEALEEWGVKTSFIPETEDMDSSGLVNNGQLFKELKHPSVLKNGSTGVVVASSSTPSAACIERLNPLSPNRPPEWLLYQNMFGGYRPLTPRLIDMSYINHILLNACERHFERFEEKYARCFKHARGRSTNSQMALNLTERLFKESYVLTDFQESIIRELESRYCYPELVAKSLYEILCFLDATMASQPLVDLYLSCIRGFESPTRIHYITSVLYQLSVNWPSVNPEEAILKEDVLMLLEHIYKKASRITGINASELLTEYQMATRSGPITLTSLRSYLVTTMLHFEDPLLLYFNGLLSYQATSSSVVEMNFDNFVSALKGKWEEKIEGKLHIRYLTASCGFNKKADLTTKELACVAASMWSSNLWMNM